MVLASQLRQIMGETGWWIFLVGFWGAVFSSLLGVWQSVPYIFTDFLFLRKDENLIFKEKIDFTKTKPYKLYLFAITFIPIPLLWMTVKSAQLSYAIFGSLFMPLLALTLLILNNNSNWIGKENKNSLTTNFILVLTLFIFSFIGVRKIISILSRIIGT